MIVPNIQTMQFLIFEIFTKGMILWCFSYIFYKTRELYNLSMHKGLLFFSNANLFFFVSFFIALMESVSFYFWQDFYLKYMNDPLSYISMITGAIGGFLLAYSLVWKRFERQDSKGSRFFAIIIIISMFVTLIEMLLYYVFGIYKAYLFFFVMLLVMSLSIIVSDIDFRKKKIKCCKDPFISYVIVSIGIFSLIFLEFLLIDIIPLIHFYLWGMITVFIFGLKHNVRLIVEEKK